MLKIARESGEGQASATQIQELGDQRLNELNAQSERLQEQLQQFQDSTANRDDPARIALQQQIEQNQIDLRRADLDAQIEVRQLERGLLQEFSRRLGPIIQAVAEAHQLHLVLPIPSDFL